MSKTSSVFSTEEMLVDAFASHLARDSAPFELATLIREFDYRSGRTDVLVSDCENQILAFEAKLTDWRKAVHQAWRNTSFAERTYVVLPADVGHRVLRYRTEFERLGVGLCLVSDATIEIAIESKLSEPVLLWLHEKAKSMLATHGERLH
ncbi:hypothetical protein [Chitiniphilus eburneus]|uniref:Uncharacterized protein n=1 Tax=Chitiniphilus eburneus TaxID=2571148 RepID=A0A4U0QAR8_9NEIS|nr:hypothetical protein [Chitiniphilus eburneus]TJZ77532.1 hypothetical protein FAZ21_04165 [Chitiniphilus eburneus]